MGLWFCEFGNPNLKLCSRVKETLHSENTGLQKLAIMDTYEFGRALVLDGAVQTTSRHEFIYHEMITHVPIYTHSHPEVILLMGGGDGGSIREILKHPEVRVIHLVEADRRVVEVCKEHLPATGDYLHDPQVEILYEDGVNYLPRVKDKYDVIIVNLPDPVGPAEELYGGEFSRSIYTALKGDGLFVTPMGSPFFQGDIIPRIYHNIASNFPIARMYPVFIPSYPGGIRCLTLGSKEYDPLSTLAQKTPIPTRYYTCRLHRSAFVLPRFLEEMLAGMP